MHGQILFEWTKERPERQTDRLRLTDGEIWNKAASQTRCAAAVSRRLIDP